MQVSSLRLLCKICLAWDQLYFSHFFFLWYFIPQIWYTKWTSLKAFKVTKPHVNPTSVLNLQNNTTFGVKEKCCQVVEHGFYESACTTEGRGMCSTYPVTRTHCFYFFQLCMKFAVFNVAVMGGFQLQDHWAFYFSLIPRLWFHYSRSAPPQ